jgi:hypothetical protein
MRRVKYSLAWIMFAVGLVAVDCAILRAMGGSDDLSIIRLTSLVLMGNILALGLFRFLTHRNHPQPFLIGFEVTGLATALLVGLLPRFGSGAILATHNHLKRFFWHPLSDFAHGDPFGRFLVFIILIVLPAVVTTAPLVIIALIGGWLGSRHRNA